MLPERLISRNCLPGPGAYNAAQGFARSNQRLAGRTLGLVGFGNSARLTAQRARGFDLRVLATRRSLTPVDPSLGVELCDLDRVLRDSDYVSRGGIENMAAVLSGHWPRPGHVVNDGVLPRIALAPWPGA